MEDYKVCLGLSWYSIDIREKKNLVLAWANTPDSTSQIGKGRVGVLEVEREELVFGGGVI